MNLKIASRDHCWWHITTCQHGSVSISTLLITSCGVLDGSKILSFVDGLLTRLWITVKLVVVSGSSLCTPPSATWWCPTSKWMIHPFNTQMDDPQTKNFFASVTYCPRQIFSKIHLGLLFFKGCPKTPILQQFVEIVQKPLTPPYIATKSTQFIDVCNKVFEVWNCTGKSMFSFDIGWW